MALRSSCVMKSLNVPRMRAFNASNRFNRWSDMGDDNRVVGSLEDIDHPQIAVTKPVKPFHSPCIGLTPAMFNGSRASSSNLVRSWALSRSSMRCLHSRSRATVRPIRLTACATAVYPMPPANCVVHQSNKLSNVHIEDVPQQFHSRTRRVHSH